LSIIAQTATNSIVEPAMLLSVAKPILAIIPFVIYARLVGNKLDRDSRDFQIDPSLWSSVFSITPILALAAVLLIPIFWIGWPVSILMLGGVVVAYASVRNRRVPENFRWKIGALKLGESVQARREAAAQKAAKLRFLDASKKERPVPTKEDPLFAAHQALEMLLDPAMQSRATRVDLAPTTQGFQPSQVVDGVRVKRDAMPPDLATAIIDYLKSIAGLEVAERRKKQAADFFIVSGETLKRASLTVSGGSSGQTMRIDFDRESQLSKPVDTVGLLEEQMKILSPVVEIGQRQGVILVAAAPGQGLSTLLYSLVARHDAFTCNVKSIEKQVELRVDGVDQQVWSPANPAVDYASHLQSIIRRGPDIVMVTDLYEPRVGQVVAPSAADILFYMGVTVDAPPGQELAAALREWFRSVGDLTAGSKALRAVVVQRLMRKLCEYCRQPHPRAAEIAKRIGVPAGTTPNILVASGKVQVKNRVESCPVCNGSGFMGQIGVHEVLGFDNETRAMLAANDAKGAYAAARRKLKAPSLQEAALRRVRDGVTSVEEYQRIFAVPQPPGSGGAQPAPARPPASPASPATKA